MINPKNLKIKRISFSALVDYWIEVDHFQVKNKKYLEIITQLGHLRLEVSKPKYVCYGLYDAEKLIGVTHISEWNNFWIRYRTINIRKEYRGNDLGWLFLKSCILKDWLHCETVFGWVKRDHIDWSVKKGFLHYDNLWEDNHTAMIAPVAHFSENINSISFSE